jgi:hypothetical protein
MMTVLIQLLANASPPIPVTNIVAETDGKKTEEGMMTSPPEVNPVAIADFPETEMLTPVTTRSVSDIRTK